LFQISDIQLIFVSVKTLQINISDRVARDLEKAVQAGVFDDANAAVCAALEEFISRGKFELMEQQQLSDIAWALREKSDGK
jgi:hypothetical protein